MGDHGQVLASSPSDALTRTRLKDNAVTGLPFDSPLKTYMPA